MAKFQHFKSKIKILTGEVKMLKSDKEIGLSLLV